MSINFISCNGSDETRNMHAKSKNIEIMMGSETDEIIDELLKSLLQNYQKDLGKLMRGTNFVFDSVDFLYYHLEKTSLKRTWSSYIDSEEWLKYKKATINPKILTIIAFSMLKHCIKLSEYYKDPQRISKIKP